MSKKTWKDLKAEGVRRCCACFKSGGRCKSRVAADVEGAAPDADASFCAKHGEQYHRQTQAILKPLREQGLI